MKKGMGSEFTFGLSIVLNLIQCIKLSMGCVISSSID